MARKILDIALVAEEKGLASSMQEAWTARTWTVSAFLGLGNEEQLYCGMALGYAGPSATVNALRSSRVPAEEFTSFIND